MTKRQARKLGAMTGREDVRVFVQEHGQIELLGTTSNWDEAAINAGVAGLLHVPRELHDSFYVAYDRNARDEAKMLKRQARAKHERGEELDTGIFGVPEYEIADSNDFLAVYQDQGSGPRKCVGVEYEMRLVRGS